MNLYLIKRFSISLVTLIACYAAAELACTFGAKPHPSTLGSDSFFIWEESGRTVQFDPIRGYRLTKIPSRVARVTHGTIEFVGTVKGNAQGFPDADDWTFKKSPDVKRYLVFGDSFSAGTNLDINWPDRVERANPHLQLLNVSTDGAGLANWHSNLTRLMMDYDFDAVIFAVYPGDLRRSFTASEHRNADRPLFGRFGWEPSAFPRSLAEAMRGLRPLDGPYASRIVSTEKFNAALEAKRFGGAAPSRPWIASRIYELASRPVPQRPVIGDEEAASARLAMIRDMRVAINGKPVVVVHLPTREEAVSHSHLTGEARDFAAQLGAKFWDGGEALDGLLATEIRQSFLPYDGHWNKIGSDRFADWVEKRL
jgi:hypothetical protein